MISVIVWLFIIAVVVFIPTHGVSLVENLTDKKKEQSLII